MQKQSNRLRAYLWLAIGGLLGFAIAPQWLMALSVWIAPVFLLRFARLQRWWLGYLLITVVMGVVTGIAWYGVIPLPLPAHIAIMAAGAITASLPYLFDRVLTPRLRTATGDVPFVSTLLFPCAVTAIEFLSLLGNPMGTFGSVAYTQFTFLPFIQLVSITGLWGITFLIAWFASVVNWAWGEEFSWPHIRFGVSIYAVILLVVLGYGAIRLLIAPDLNEQTATIAVTSHTAAELAPETLFPLLESDPAAFRAETQARHAAYLAWSEEAAKNGAELLLWPEGAAVGLADDVDTVVEQGKSLARDRGIYLAMPTLSVYPNEDRVPENRLLIADPNGEIILNHVKYGGNQFEGTLLGSGELQVVGTPFGTLSGVICWDMDFPAVIRQIGQQGVDVLLVPSRDWQEIDPLHGQMAVYRGIENGVTIIRQTDGGLSLISDPYGRTITSYSHFATDDWQMTASAPTTGISTLYSQIGDVFGWISIFGFILLAAWAIIAGRKERKSEHSAEESQAVYA